MEEKFPKALKKWQIQENENMTAAKYKKRNQRGDHKSRTLKHDKAAIIEHFSHKIVSGKTWESTHCSKLWLGQNDCGRRSALKNPP